MCEKLTHVSILLHQKTLCDGFGIKSMKRLKFDVFSLISPLAGPVDILQDAPLSSEQPDNYPLRLANAIRENCFVIPQEELLGIQVTKNDSPVRMLRFMDYEVPDYAIRKIIEQLDEDDKLAAREYVWKECRTSYSQELGKWITLDPEFSDEAERAFRRVFMLLEQLDLLRLKDVRG